MSNTDSIDLQRASGQEPRLSPFVEKSLLFGIFAAAAGFWMAVIWWIVR